MRSIDFDGHEPFVAVAEENLFGVNTADAVEATYGALPPAVALEGDQSAIGYRNAREVLDWAPERSGVRPSPSPNPSRPSLP